MFDKSQLSIWKEMQRAGHDPSKTSLWKQLLLNAGQILSEQKTTGEQMNRFQLQNSEAVQASVTPDLQFR